MKDYKRWTNREWEPFASTYIVSGKILSRFTDLEDKIERGEIDYVADKDKQIASLTTENKAYADKVLTAIKILQNSDGFKARTAISQAIGVLLGNKDNKWKREID